MSQISSTVQGAFHQPEEAAVPRRFGAGGLFVLVTIYCILFRVLTLLGASSSAVLVVALFLTSISAAQAILFHGSRPRTASYLAGGIVAPAILLLATLDDLTFGLAGLRPAALGWNTPGRVASVLVVLWFAGRPLGYFVGCATAGVFLITQRGRAKWSGHSPTAQAIPDHEVYVGGTSASARWRGYLRPFQPDRPVIGANVAAAWIIFASLLLAPYTAVPSRCFGIGVCLGLVVAWWTGVFQLKPIFTVSRG